MALTTPAPGTHTARDVAQILTVRGVTRFYGSDGQELRLTLEEVNLALYLEHSRRLNRDYERTLGYQIRKLLGLRIPRHDNDRGWV